MLFTNSELLARDNLYALAVSSDKSRVAYVSYWYCDMANVLCNDCNFISNMRDVGNFIPDKDIFYVNVDFLFANKDEITTVADNVKTIRIGEVSYYLIDVYAYSHSAISLSLTPYSDKWDSGLGGFVLIKETDCPLEEVVSRAQDFISSLELYMNGCVFRVDAFSADNQEDYLDCTVGIIEPSELSQYLNEIDFPCKEEDIFLSYDISDKLRATYTLEV